jgi:hypothetical protein
MPKLKEFQMRTFFFEGFSSFFYCVSVLYFFSLLDSNFENYELTIKNLVSHSGEISFYLLPSGIHAGYFPEAT